MQEIKSIVEKNTGGEKFNAFEKVYPIRTHYRIRYWTLGILATLLIILLLPWTQNIRARGTVTTLRQEQRPQQVNTVIGGRIIKWYVKEGDFVKAGDTLAQLAEIKDSYLDTNLLQRTGEQLDAKKQSIGFYADKVNATTQQIDALGQARLLKEQQLQNKLKQLELKIIADSMDAVAAANDFRIAEAQYERQRIMRDSGLSSLVQLEQRNRSYQSAQAKHISAGIKLANTRTDLVNTRIELNQVRQEYAEKIYKAQSERAATQSEIAGGEGEVAKLANQYANYNMRSQLYYIRAPQSGQVVKARKAGINEVVKEGEMLLEIVPEHMQYAIEMYVRPVDAPLLSVGQDVRFIFDGFPAIVFSGWPQASHGTFGGKVVAIEGSLSSNGMFRVLVGEDADARPWPPSLRMGAGAMAIALLKDVPLGYELWRNINGFPPDYYIKETKDEQKK